MLIFLAIARAEPIPLDTTQLILGWSSGWDDSSATLQRYTRVEGSWVAQGTPIPTRIGRSGLAWGVGLHDPQPGLQKKEGDWRAPAGIFSIGTAFGDALLSPAPVWPMSVVTERTLWVEDPESALYNQHLVILEGRPLTDWEEKQRMRFGDDAHRLKLVIAHNMDPPRTGAGSAIFFHIWRRDGTAPTAGCTAMPADSMEAVIRWLQPDATPVFVLLPVEMVAQLQADWGLPALPTDTLVK